MDLYLRGKNYKAYSSNYHEKLMDVIQFKTKF